ncbi:MAG: thiol peroxidase [Bacteroidales bacterium]|nr:thiol peroxidase [Bacteroidales bacterium]MCB8999914.1 thiol peroxidase [Bacteroidales bacterium]
MANITLKGNPVHTVGTLPALGSIAPDFKITKTDLSESSLSEYAGKRIVLNIFPSLDTSTCAASVRHFNAKAQSLENTVVLCVSMDLPFAHKRFCSAEGLENVVSASIFRHQEFGRSYGVTITDGPLAGLMSRSVVILDENNKIIYTEQVPEISQEPDYESALAVL